MRGFKLVSRKTQEGSALARSTRSPAKLNNGKQTTFILGRHQPSEGTPWVKGVWRVQWGFTRSWTEWFLRSNLQTLTFGAFFHTPEHGAWEVANVCLLKNALQRSAIRWHVSFQPEHILKFQAPWLVLLLWLSWAYIWFEWHPACGESKESRRGSVVAWWYIRPSQ